ncbi:uncharacterized protein B0P05DRAFT_506827 [Gilbertella persicaria]|uniref:C2H2-type domain-containing protein n=1 Tax=Rhizopus stolonifer TaxID=4846 RepID=A0A367JPC5_RHIST|nr:uncharacterized protein B0P05DRAFT_506827 [Gilbertella persicaria]KAI8085900.1 hypothetical protein B0P05DRAFT_506827 [Gilbertella persicaria]RCH91794.1 hypothetical protein CU098_009585 [Rhizopus stolonifer]
MNEGLLSVKNASGRQVSLLNSNEEPQPVAINTPEEWQQDPQQSKRKYHCIEPGCNKSFTTSGHLARHNRIHTGEKNFPCLFPGCQSRFSRQDNMMQHYRTHMSPKSRRSQKRGIAEDARPRPRLHAHHRIRSDPVRVEPPLTIDQHLSNYHQSLRATPHTDPVERYTPVRFNFPLPLSSTARTPSNLKKIVQKEDPTPSPTLSHSSSSTSLPSLHQMMDDNTTNSSEPDNPTVSKEPPKSSTNLFYQHRPLTFTRPQNTSFPYTLLHPAQQQHQQQQEELSNVTRNQNSGNKDDPMEEDDKNNKSPSSGGLLQLAHIVSTFG